MAKVPSTEILSLATLLSNEEMLVVRHNLPFDAFLLWAGGAQEKHKTTDNPAIAQPKKLSAEELFKRISPSVFVVESLDASGQPIEQGSAVVIRVEKQDSWAFRFSKPATNKQNPTPKDDSSDQWQVVGQTPASQPAAPADAFLITNYHVVKEGVHLRVLRGESFWPADLVAFDADHDLAELKVKGLQAPAVVIRKSSTLAVGEQVYAIGAPEGLELTISQGLISGLRQLDSGVTIQTTAAISPGSSGGGLFDSEGRLVGITAAFLKEGENLNFAIPAETTLSVGCHSYPSQLECDVSRANNFLGRGLALDGTQESRSIAMSSYQSASELLRGVLQLQPSDICRRDGDIHALPCEAANAWSSLSDGYGSLGLYGKAAEAGQQAARLDPTNPWAWYSLATIYSLLEEDDKTVEADQRAIALDPHNLAAWTSLAPLYKSLGQYGKAVEALEKAISLDPDGGNLSEWLDLGELYYDLGQRSEVMRVYEKIKTIDQKSADNFFAKYVQAR